MAKLYFRYGAMNCGKTTLLIQVAHNYEERGMNILIIKPAIDTKKEDNIYSRLNVERKVDILLKATDSLIEKLGEKRCDAILIDEAQFLEKKQVDEAYFISKEYDIPVLCYGLRTDFLMNGFPGSTRLLELADDIEELKTICRCGKKATFNLRLKNNVPIFSGNQVAIDDGKDLITYESVCGNCYLRLRKKEN